MDDETIRMDIFRIIEKEIKKRTIPVKKEDKEIPEHYGKEKHSGRKTH